MTTISQTPDTVTANPTSAAPSGTPPVITSPADRLPSRTKLHVETRDQTLVNGVLANLGDVATFALPTGTYTPDQLVAAFQSRIAASEATKANKNAWHATVQAERQAESDIAPLRKSIKQFVASRYGADSAKLAEFGFAPAKPRKTTVQSKATAIQKSEATRVARHTMGRVQKQSIHGQPAAEPAPAGAPAAAGATK
ncbi:MAG TPA: hypothetical protein VGM06_13930 [Polyangiaceae bacterium]|jgi:hypothetical protein